MPIDDTSAIGSDFLGVAESGGKSYEINKDFGAMMTDLADSAVSQLSGGGATFARDDHVYDTISTFVDELDDVTADYQVGNSKSLNAEAYDYANDLESVLNPILMDALSGEGNSADAMGYLSGFSALTGQFLEPEPEATPMSAGALSGGGNAAGMTEVNDLLAEASAADTSSEKADLLIAAIDGMIAQLTGGGEGGASDTGGSGAPSMIGEADSEQSAALEEMLEEIGHQGAPIADPMPQFEMVTERYEGDELMGMLNAGGAAITHQLDGDDDAGIGVEGGEDDEIDGQEVLTFMPNETFQGGEVVIEDLFADKDVKGQEVGTITVKKDGEVVDEIQVNGDEDGTQSVRIDQEFDELEFSIDNQNGHEDGSFSVSSISVDREVPVEGGVEGGQGGDSAGGVAEGGDVDFEAARLTALLQALAQFTGFVDQGSSLSEAEQTALLGAVGDVMETITNSVDQDTGTASMNSSEVVSILSGVQTLVGATDQFASEVEGVDVTKAEVMNTLIAGVAEIAGEFTGPTDPFEDTQMA